MKTLKLFVTALCLIVAGTAAKAARRPANMILSKEYDVETYVEAMCHGNLQGLDEVLDQHATFSIVRGDKLVSFDRDAIMASFNENKNVDQSCTAAVSTLQSDEHVAVVKVDMQYSDFTRTNYVTLTNTGNGWKITNVHSVFKS